MIDIERNFEVISKEITDNMASYVFSIPAAYIIATVDRELEERAKTFQIAGFRTGKVPLSMVRRQIGDEIMQQQMNAIVHEVVDKLLKEDDLNPMGDPIVDVQNFDQSGVMTCSLKIELLQKITSINDMVANGLRVDKYTIEISDGDVDKVVRDIIAVHAKYENANDDYCAQSGDAMIVDFCGTIDGVEFDGGKANGLRIIIGANKFLPDLENSLIGKKKGEEFDVPVTFPEVYQMKDLQGKTAMFNVKVWEVLCSNVANITDEIAQRFNMENAETMMKTIRDTLQADANEKTKVFNSYNVLLAISNFAKIHASDDMIASERANLDAKMESMKNSDGEKSDFEIESQKKFLDKMAIQNAKNSTIILNIAKNKKIQISGDDLMLLKTKFLDNAKTPQEKQDIREAFEDKRRNVIVWGLLEEKVKDFLLKTVPGDEKIISLEEFVTLQLRTTMASDVESELRDDANRLLDNTNESIDDERKSE